MKKFIRIFLIVFVICGLSAFIAWCGGFNFDTRNPLVAVVIIFTLGICVPVAAAMGIE